VLAMDDETLDLTVCKRRVLGARVSARLAHGERLALRFETVACLPQRRDARECRCRRGWR